MILKGEKILNEFAILIDFQIFLSFKPLSEGFKLVKQHTLYIGSYF
jgi:hypothetical protein